MKKLRVTGERMVMINDRTVRMRIPAGRALTVIHTPPTAGTVTVDVACGPRSTVTWITLVSAAKELTLIQSGTVAAKASLTWRSVTGGKGNLRCSLASRVTGDDGWSAISWVVGAKGTAQQHLSATNIFAKKRGRGEIILRTVAAGKAHVSCSGSIRIGPDGTGTHTHLTQETLMLDTTAKVDAVPALEIKTNDVKASHSATVARVTPETLFYFQSRGIEEKDARHMFINGFVAEMLAALPEEVRKKAATLL